MDALNKELISELAQSFAINNGYYLDKALTLLKQFQTGSVHQNPKRIKSQDIIGLKAKDIYFVVMTLNNVFGYAVLQRVETYPIPKTDDSKGNETDIDFIYENTGYLETAISILEFIKSGQDKKLTRKDGQFFYLNESLDIRKGNLRNLLEVILDITQGNSRVILYKELFVELEKIYKNKSEKQLKQFIQKYLTSKGYHLDTKVQKKFKGAQMLFETIDEVGIKFHNDK